MSQLRSSKYKQNDDFLTKERMILIQRIQFLESENEQLRNRQISLKKINTLLIDALNSNPKVEERVINQLRVLNSPHKNDQLKFCQEEIVRLKYELSKRKMSFEKTQAQTYKPDRVQEFSQKRSFNNSRTKLRQSTIKQSSQLDRFSLLISNPPSVVNSSNCLKSKHKRRLSQRVYEIQFKDKQDHTSKFEVQKLIRQKQMIQKQIQNCQRKCNEDIDSQIESIVCIVKNKKKSKQNNHSFREIREQPLMRNIKSKIGLESGIKMQRFVTPRYSKQRH